MTRFATIFASAMALMLGTATTAQADVYDHLDRLALQIQQQASELLRETTHYRHTRGYFHLVRDAADIKRRAGHIHLIAHVGANLHHLESDVQQLDKAFHHFENVLRSVEVGARYGPGHVHGRTSHVHSLLHAIETNLHHMAADLRSLNGVHDYHGVISGGRLPVISAPIHGGGMGHYMPRVRMFHHSGIRFHFGF